MALEKFLYPIVDSGYFFGFELLDVTKDTMPEPFSLNFKYRLTNLYPMRFQIPIHISHVAYLNCMADYDFEHDPSTRIRSDRVVDVQSNNVMYGYGDDHHVLFEPNEQKEFSVLFKATGTDFETFDTEFFMQPLDGEYGRYRLRYDFKRGQIIQRYCLRKYKVEMKPFPSQGVWHSPI
jgi:hypothetical protein